MGRRLFHLQQPTTADHKLYKNVPREIAMFAEQDIIIMQQYLLQSQLSTSVDCSEQEEESQADFLLDCTSTSAMRNRLRALICDCRNLEYILKNKALWNPGISIT